MTERVDIANMALSFLGEIPITSLDDDSSNAKQLTIQYIPARDATLEAHDWSFAIERFELPPLTEVPVYGASRMFAVPSNILRVIACDNPQINTSISNAPINSQEQIDWVLENGNIVCNESVVYARGVRRVEDEGSFSPLFVQAFAAKLAMLLSINLTASADIQERVSQYYAYAINEAKTRDGMQGRSRRLRSRTLLRVR
jgi:hypothetical protein